MCNFVYLYLDDFSEEVEIDGSGEESQAALTAHFQLLMEGWGLRVHACARSITSQDYVTGSREIWLKSCYVFVQRYSELDTYLLLCTLDNGIRISCSK